MKLHEILNSTGIIILATGAFITVKGYFSEKNLDILNRTSLNFTNLEHFESMIYQKYSSILGFILIILGSITQLIPSIFIISNKNEISHLLAITYYCLISPLFIFSMNIVCKYISQKKINLIYLYHSIKMIESYKTKNNTSKESYDFACNRLITITNQQFKKTQYYNLTDKIIFVNQKYKSKFEKFKKHDQIDPYHISD